METNKEQDKALMRAEFETKFGGRFDMRRDFDKQSRYFANATNWIWEAWQAALSQRSEEVPFAAAGEQVQDGYVLAPHYRGYAHLGTGNYILNHSCAGDPAEFVASIATEAEKDGRVVGDLQTNSPDALVQPDAMAVRIRFENVAGLDALEQQLRLLRVEHFPESLTPAAQHHPARVWAVRLGEQVGMPRPVRIQLDEREKTSVWLENRKKTEACDGGDWVRFWKCESHTYETGRLNEDDCKLIEATIDATLAAIAQPANRQSSTDAVDAARLDFMAQHDARTAIDKARAAIAAHGGKG